MCLFGLLGQAGLIFGFKTCVTGLIRQSQAC